MERLPIEIRKEIRNRYLTLLSEMRDKRIREVIAKKQINDGEELVRLAIEIGSLRAVKISLETYKGESLREHLKNASRFENVKIYAYLFNLHHPDEKKVFCLAYIRDSLLNNHLPIFKFLSTWAVKEGRGRGLDEGILTVVNCCGSSEARDFAYKLIMKENPEFFQYEENLLRFGDGETSFFISLLGIFFKQLTSFL